jgi:ABC-type transport system involved in multi-copper enzyme maturation permease subunit
MSLQRLLRVFQLDFLHNLRRPLFWILILILGLIAYGLSYGGVQIQSGDSAVGGTKAWITSEFAVAMSLTIVFFLVYIFFIAVAAGMAVIHDEELKVGELLYATALRPSEYVWGKFLAVLLSFLAVLGVHLLTMMVCNHLMPAGQLLEIRGPFALGHYLRPVLFLVLPALLFLTGTAFAVGEWTRRPILLYVLPVAEFLVCGFFLWDWAPTWLDPRTDRALMLLDPAGFRWLNETWLKVDRGVDFYNHAPIEFDGPFLASRGVFAVLGLLSVAVSQWHFGLSLRGSATATPTWWMRFLRTRQPAAFEVPAAMAPLASMQMRVRPPGFVRSAWLVARSELTELRHSPGLYLFGLLILLLTLLVNFVALGAFQTPLLMTSGTMAVATVNVLSLYVCLLLMFYTVEALLRERRTGLAPIHYATPVPTTAILFGKALANSVVGIVILLAGLLGCAIVLLIQGKVGIDLVPFGLVWGLLLVPTFVAWTAFTSAVLALTGSRYTTYGIGLGVLVFTGYRQLTDQMNWVGNWLLWRTLHWTDMGVFELDRTALVLNRLMVLGLAVLFTIVAATTFRRKDFDAVRVVQRLYPWALVKSGLRLLPWAAVPLVVGGMLWLAVGEGYEGAAAKKRGKDYWKANLATWKDAQVPAITAVDMDLELDPARHLFRVRGTYDLRNHLAAPLRQIPVTGGEHWENVTWTMNDEDFEPENHAGLYVFTPSPDMAPGGRLRIGFAYEGRFPKGISENGRGRENFILPAGVVLTSFGPDFAPVLGYIEGIGVDKDNRYESRSYPDDFFEGITEPLFGSATAFTTRIRITAPAAYTVNSVGVKTEESVAEGRRTVVWRSDHPVRFFNVVAGRWAERHGQDTVIYYHPEHAYNIDEMSAALDAARRYYSEWFYPYPWRELKLSEFPALASYAQGFPTNITFSEGIGFLTRSDPKADAAFVVTAHEAAHQWWGNILTPGKGPGGNILSEGMAHFSTILLADQVKGLRSRIEFCKRIEESYGNRRRKDSEQPLVKTDGSRPGDEAVMYDKGGWVFWMLLNHLGRERALKGLRAFIDEFHANADHPVLQDFVATMRRFAADQAAYDDFVHQWFFEVVVPEYRLSEAKREGESVTVQVENQGTGRFSIAVAAVQGERFDDDGQPSPAYREARTKVDLGPEETKTVTIPCEFEPDRVLVDPDGLVLQLKRKAAVVRLRN